MNIYVTLIWVLSIAIFIIFGKSWNVKLRHPYAFLIMLKNYKIIKHEGLLNVIAPLLIISEILAGTLLLIPSLRYFAALLGIGLQLTYVIILSLNYGKKFNNICGCFELNVPSKVNFKSIVLNVAFIFAFLIILSIQKELGGI